MAREIVRTLLSLSPYMQVGVTPRDYEIVVVDNGSSQPIDRRASDSLGVTVRWLRIDDAPPSPARAVNVGLAAADAPMACVMVDGARLASPGLLCHTLLAARLHERVVVTPLGFHLGPDLQCRSTATGYDRAAEDALLEEVDWTRDGYRLFDISVLAGSSLGGWLCLPAESNALAAPRGIWEELGGYDEAFVSPGGGLVNLDAYRRACELPDVMPVLLLGEATFHQIHGGISTNSSTSRWNEFHAEYVRERGRDFVKPSRPPVCLGTPAPQVLGAPGWPALSIPAAD